jgi:uncharacterized beta-barrel protein YwiB (DUF1934 family)
MQIHFISYQEGLKTLSFKSEYEIIDGKYHFIDKTQENTRIILDINNDSIIIKRIGNVNSIMEFKKNLKTISKYKNNLGLEFDFLIDTKAINLYKNGYEILYDYYVENDFIGSVKLILMIK